MGERIKRTKKVKADGIREARKMLAEFQTEVESGEYIAPQKMTLGAFVVEWRSKYATKELAPLTLKNYDLHLKNHILPVFRHPRMDPIKPLHILSFLE